VDWTSTFQDASLSSAPEKERVLMRFVAEQAASDPQTYQMGSDPRGVREIFLQLLPQVRSALRSDTDFYSSANHLMAARALSDWLRASPSLEDDELRARAQAYRFSPDADVDQDVKRAFVSLLGPTRQSDPWNGIPPGPLKLSPSDSVRSTVLCNDSASSGETFWTRKENLYAIQYPVGGSFFASRHCADWGEPSRPAPPL